MPETGGSAHRLKLIRIPASAGCRRHPIARVWQAFRTEEATMFARIAVWEPMPDDDRQWVIDAAKSVAGVKEAYHLVDPDTGNGLSIAFFDDGVDVSQVKAVIAEKAAEIGWHDAPHPSPKSETMYRVIRSG
jgi:hypothetical protein